MKARRQVRINKDVYNFIVEGRWYRQGTYISYSQLNKARTLAAISGRLGSSVVREILYMYTFCCHSGVVTSVTDSGNCGGER